MLNLFISGIFAFDETLPYKVIPRDLTGIGFAINSESVLGLNTSPQKVTWSKAQGGDYHIFVDGHQMCREGGLLVKCNKSKGTAKPVIVNPSLVRGKMYVLKVLESKGILAKVTKKYNCLTYNIQMSTVAISECLKKKQGQHFLLQPYSADPTPPEPEEEKPADDPSNDGDQEDTADSTNDSETAGSQSSTSVTNSANANDSSNTANNTSIVNNTSVAGNTNTTTDLTNSSQQSTSSSTGSSKTTQNASSTGTNSNTAANNPATSKSCCSNPQNNKEDPYITARRPVSIMRRVLDNKEYKVMQGSNNEYELLGVYTDCVPNSRPVKSCLKSETYPAV